VQRLQFFLSESTWDADRVNAQRLLLLAASQYLGSVGKIDNGIVAVTTLWADEARYCPLHVMPYTPAVRLLEWQAQCGVSHEAANRAVAR